MATRGVVVFVEEGRPNRYLYIHADMYPSGFARRLYVFLKMYKDPYGSIHGVDYWIANFIALMKFIRLLYLDEDFFWTGMGVIPTETYIMGIEYVYEVDVRRGYIKARSIDYIPIKTTPEGLEWEEKREVFFEGSIEEFVKKFLREEDFESLNEMIEKVSRVMSELSGKFRPY